MLLFNAISSLSFIETKRSVTLRLDSSSAYVFWALLRSAKSFDLPCSMPLMRAFCALSCFNLAAVNSSCFVLRLAINSEILPPFLIVTSWFRCHFSLMSTRCEWLIVALC